MADKRRYSITEIVSASGLTRNTILFRARKLGFMPGDRKRCYLSYEQIKQIIQYRVVRKNMPPRKEAINELKTALKNDGYPYKEG